MTAEIAVMNRGAVALAADSAVTVAGAKVYNTVNKLFALSYEVPVGIMVYGSADLCGVPWETVIKEFRSKFGSERRSSLREYGDAIVDFVCNGPLIKVDYQCYAVTSVAFRVLEQEVFAPFDRALHDLIEEQGQAAESEVRAELQRQVDEVLTVLRGLEFGSGWEQGDLPLLRNAYSDRIVEVVEAVFEDVPRDQGLNDRLIDVVCEYIARDAFVTSYSGVVVAGFGDDDVFPGVVGYQIEGVFLSKLKFQLDTEVATGPNNAAVIRPFAQREMVDLFMQGVDPSYKATIDGALSRFIAGLPDVIAEASELDEEAAKVVRMRIETGADRLINQFRSELDQYQLQRQVMPIIDAVAALPKDELGAMAEALVSLTSFKRRVTLDAETVGGAIDVAVISKGDGLIWLKRKHYFKPEDNPQYLSRFGRGA